MWLKGSQLIHHFCTFRSIQLGRIQSTGALQAVVDNLFRGKQWGIIKVALKSTIEQGYLAACKAYTHILGFYLSATAAAGAGSGAAAGVAAGAAGASFSGAAKSGSASGPLVALMPGAAVAVGAGGTSAGRAEVGAVAGAGVDSAAGVASVGASVAGA
jgi:hypothetical protein